MILPGAPAIPGVIGREVVTGDISKYANSNCKHCKGMGYIVTKASGAAESTPKPCRAPKCALAKFHEAHFEEIEVYDCKLRWKVAA